MNYVLVFYRYYSLTFTYLRYCFCELFFLNYYFINLLIFSLFELITFLSLYLYSYQCHA